MINKIKSRILLFPDLIGGQISGPRSARATLKTLKELGHEVALFCADADKILDYEEFDGVNYYKINSKMRFNSHFLDSALVAQFKKIIKDFKPDYYFMIGGIQKPAILAKIARKNRIKTIFLFYITDYYCAKVYAGLESGPCYQCIELSPLQSLNNNCIKGNYKYLNFLKGLIVRKKLKTEILKSYKVAGYSEDQLSIYKKIGIDESKCKKIALQFDPNELKNFPNKDGNYFLIVGQPIMEKGFHTISKILKNCKSGPQIKIIFKDLIEQQKALTKYKLFSFVESGLISTSTGLVNRQDIINVIANAKGIILPSYYPTTGEFVLIESLLLEKPVLVFNVGAHKNFISNRVNGMVSEIEDFKTFSNNIDEINTNDELRLNISKNGKKFILDLLSDNNRLNSMNLLFKD